MSKRKQAEFYIGAGWVYAIIHNVGVSQRKIAKQLASLTSVLDGMISDRMLDRIILI
jgi:hypothetical protein